MNRGLDWVSAEGAGMAKKRVATEGIKSDHGGPFNLQTDTENRP